MAATAIEPDGEALSELEHAVDVAIAACQGDTRAAVRSLVVLTTYYEQELKLAERLVSKGFARGYTFGRLLGRSSSPRP